MESTVTATLARTEGISLPRFRVFETRVHALDRATVASILSSYLDEDRPRQVATVNLDFLRLARSSQAFRRVLNAADLSVADGKPLVWLARYLGLVPCDRVTGPDVIDLCAELSVSRGARIFLLGGESDVAQQAAACLEQAHPGIQICGAYSPPACSYPFPREIEGAIAASLSESRPDIIFVAFGAPKQELWISDHLNLTGARICVGVGGSFNFISGRIRRAPVVLQRLGLEWCFRLLREPRRLWKRYLKEDLPFFLSLLTIEALGRTRLCRRALEVIR